MQIFPGIYVFVGLLGLAVGSFLNVLIYRLPRKKRIVFERSACPHCGTPIPFHHNIPLISFAVLGGKCRNCRKSISIRYPLVEMLNAACYMYFLSADGVTLAWAAHCWLASTLIVIIFVDLEFRIIPNRLTYSGIIVGLGVSVFSASPGIVDSMIGMIVGGGSLLAVAYLGEWLFKKEAMGGGDIKMAAMVGTFVGWQKVLLIFVGGAVIGLIVSIIWMIVSKKIRSERIIPFGPFLAAASFFALVYGDQALRFYIDHFLAI
jgi:leader peptidase (prepilin peptidase)/N-methyltransferase